jgi:hypothetical protein
LGRDGLRNCEEAELAFPASVDRVDHLNTLMHEQPEQVMN